MKNKWFENLTANELQDAFFENKVEECGPPVDNVPGQSSNSGVVMGPSPQPLSDMPDSLKEKLELALIDKKNSEQPPMEPPPRVGDMDDREDDSAEGDVLTSIDKYAQGDPYKLRELIIKLVERMG